MTSGISAIGGSARKKLISGSMKRRTLRYQPSTKPTGTRDQDAERDAEEHALRRHPDVQRQPLPGESHELLRHRQRGGHQRRVDQPAVVNSGPDEDQERPGCDGQGDVTEKSQLVPLVPVTRARPVRHFAHATSTINGTLCTIVFCPKTFARRRRYRRAAVCRWRTARRRTIAANRRRAPRPIASALPPTRLPYAAATRRRQRSAAGAALKDAPVRKDRRGPPDPAPGVGFRRSREAAPASRTSRGLAYSFVAAGRSRRIPTFQRRRATPPTRRVLRAWQGWAACVGPITGTLATPEGTSRSGCAAAIGGDCIPIYT